MKQVNPKYRCQITIISGDCSLPGLGISADERETIMENVNIVLHSAATVRFDEKLKMAIAINVHGTKEIIKLAKEIVNLKVSWMQHVPFLYKNYANPIITSARVDRLSSTSLQHLHTATCGTSRRDSTVAPCLARTPSS